jgi:hypothetical protein
VGKPEGNRQLSRPMHRWEGRKEYFKRTGWESMVWIKLTEDTDRMLTVLNAMMNRRVQQKAENFLNICEACNFS